MPLEPLCEAVMPWPARFTVVEDTAACFTLVEAEYVVVPKFHSRTLVDCAEAPRQPAMNISPASQPAQLFTAASRTTRDRSRGGVPRERHKRPGDEARCRGGESMSVGRKRQRGKLWQLL